MAKIFKYKGKSVDELKNLSIKEFANLLPSRERRSLNRGISEQHKIVLEKIKEGKKKIRTHCRDLIILPQMIGAFIQIHNGNGWVPVTINEEMIGHRLGEYTITRKKLKHSAPGVGATRSSASLSVR
ncbi:30S ribosomal protein S19 [Candidatus Woesearchaeota archaeon CG10_big_fil_rev_8_21_14_0_10_30_7]|nr:MAG: 30S ribosomal protein S19 [Candidatus Woesearchaeota archaeon CG10_big_fil_rev_8_21_14_0_10_30_7]